MPSPLTIEHALKRLPPKFGLKKIGEDFMIRCPDHAGGGERTPSFIINGSVKKRFQLGAGHCFSCGANYSTWAKLQDRLAGGKKSLVNNADVMDLQFYDFASDLEDVFLEENLPIEKIHPELQRAMDWDGRDWRGIPGQFMKDVGACMTLNYKFGLRAFIPCKVNKRLVGGVFANLKKQGKKNYFNTKGSWVTTTLLFYDYVRKHFKKYRLVVIVEGPRDAARLLSYGIPAVALLGTGHTKHEIKFHLLSNLPLKYIVTALDGDKAGRYAAKNTYHHLKDEYEVKKYALPEGKDVCSISEKKIIKFKRMLEKKIGRRLPKGYHAVH